MNPNDLFSEESGTVCFRCNRRIKPHDRLFIMSASLENEMPSSDGGCVISSLCFPCASIILSEAVITQKLFLPSSSSESPDDDAGFTSPSCQRARSEVSQAGTIRSTNPESADGEPKAALSFEVSGGGFRLNLQCNDGLSYATSELFTWNRIAQLLIAANPELFGVLNEPWHYCFPETLVSLGYCVPDWPE